eukprot:Sspe_Gene.33436::Locus_16325_Transcript_1_1_Confidence_1.000_Length_2242::g.33436::m.33436
MLSFFKRRREDSTLDTSTVATSSEATRCDSSPPCPETVITYRLVVCHEVSDQYIPLYDTYRESASLRHPDEQPLQTLLQLMHGSLPLRLETAHTKVHWLHAGTIVQMMVTKMFKMRFPDCLVDQHGCSPRSRVDDTDPEPMHDGSSFQSKTTFTVAGVITITNPGTAGVAPQMRFLAASSVKDRSSNLAETLSAIDDTELYSRMNDVDACPQECGGNDPFDEDVRPRGAAGVLELLQSNFSYLNHLVEKAHTEVQDLLLDLSSSPDASFQYFRLCLPPYTLQQSTRLAELAVASGSSISSFANPIRLYPHPVSLTEHPELRNPTPAQLLHAFRHFRKPVDMELVASAVTAVLTWHQGWLPAVARSCGSTLPVPPQRRCRVLIHGSEFQPTNALLVVLTFFVRCAELCSTVEPLACPSFPPRVPPGMEDTEFSRAMPMSSARSQQFSAPSSQTLTSSLSFSPTTATFQDSSSPSGAPDSSCIASYAASVAIAALLAGESPWSTPVEYVLDAETQPVSAGRYNFAGIVNTMEAPFVLLGVVKDDIVEEDLRTFIDTPLPVWMEESETSTCVVVDSVHRRCTVVHVLPDELVTRPVGGSALIRGHLRTAIDSYRKGVPSSCAAESLLIGLEEVVVIAECVRELLCSKRFSFTNREDIRYAVPGVASSDLTLLASVCCSLCPELAEVLDP